jgi:hypothetical protein
VSRGREWRKSSFSFSNSNCVEVRTFGDGYRSVRNSRYPGTELRGFTPAEWEAFTEGVRAGEFDIPDGAP